MSLMHKRIRNCLVSYCYNSMFCLFFFGVRQMLEIKIEFYKLFGLNNNFILFYFTHMNSFGP